MIGAQLLKWDRQRRGAEIIFASTASGLALHTAQRQVARYEDALLALLVPADPSADTLAYRVIASLMSQIDVHIQALNTLMQDAGQRLLELAFWAERPGERVRSGACRCLCRPKPGPCVARWSCNTASS